MNRTATSHSPASNELPIGTVHGFIVLAIGLALLGGLALVAGLGPSSRRSSAR